MKIDYVLVIGKISLGIFLAFLIGVTSTLFGIGGGPLLVPLLIARARQLVAKFRQK